MRELNVKEIEEVNGGLILVAVIWGLQRGAEKLQEAQAYIEQTLRRQEARRNPRRTAEPRQESP